MKILDVQQGTEEWKAARLGVITGTRLKCVLGKASKTLLYELLAESLAPVKENGASEEMERGVEYEYEAVNTYEAITGNLTEGVGLCLHDAYDWLGVSPDALVKVGKKYTGAIEVKCPDTKTHIKYLVENKIPSEYKAQVLQYFIVNTDLEWLDFVSYDPRIDLDEMKIAIIRVTREELKEDIEAAMEKLFKFREQWEKLQAKYIF